MALPGDVRIWTKTSILLSTALVLWGKFKTIQLVAAILAITLAVNEIYTCAKYSAKNGWWNERLKSDKAFVTAMKNMCKADVLAMQSILKVKPDAVFIQS